MQHYGYRYDYTRRNIDRELSLGPLPAWTADLTQQLRRDGYAPRPLNQVIVNEYLPGQGISAHVDCTSCFDDTILAISLGSSCMMTLSRRDGSERVDQLLEPGSLLVLGGEARYEMRHAIAARKTDTYDGGRLVRGRRVSLTFRTVLS